MHIRYICSDHEKLTDNILTSVARIAIGKGLNIAGVVQPVDAARPGEKCHIVLALLPDGELRDISLDLGSDATSCRLDSGALENVALSVQQRVAGAQALIVNKFGKQEASGRGLVPAIGVACERGIPVLLGVAPQLREAFLEFSGGMAEELPAEVEAAAAWLESACRQRVD